MDDTRTLQPYAETVAAPVTIIPDQHISLAYDDNLARY